jgi:hypothetical protein
MVGEPALAELEAALRELAGRNGRVAGAVRLKEGVYRVLLVTARANLSVVAKRLDPVLAYRNQLAIERWLPAAQLAHAAPALLAVAAERAGRTVWHVYEDVGCLTLADCRAGDSTVNDAVSLVATIHARFANDPLLAECRLWGEDHGIAFFASSVRGAIAAVRAAARAPAPRRHREICRRLLDRLEHLAEDCEQRTRALADHGGPETLLHGDLWRINAAVVRDTRLRQSQVRLVDWDHVGAGSFSYDLSTFVIRFPASERAGIVDLYRRAAGRLGFRLPPDGDLTPLFTTAECARLANLAIWPAVSAAREGAPWAFNELAEVVDWFDPVEAQCAL